MSLIHPTAIVDPKAELDSSVKVGPYAIIGPRVSIGADCEIGPHAILTGPMTIGRNNRIASHASVGADPQDKKFKGEEVWLTIGDGNTIREFVTLNRGTGVGGGYTRIGDDNWIMAYVHMGHDCILGNHCVVANNTSFAGHVIVEDYVNFAGFSLVHQFCKIGKHAFLGMNAKVNGDVPPYVTIAGDQSRPRGINSEGLRRRGFTPEQIAAIKRGYKTLYARDLPLAEAVAELERMAVDHPELQILVDFIAQSERGLLR